MTERKHIVLLHGALGSAEQLEPLAAVLSAFHHAHILAFEGHGSAPPHNRPFRMEHFAENILGLLDREGIERADFFGYSMGGYTALVFALAHAERVGRITTLGTKFRWDAASAARENVRLDPKVIRAKVPHFADTLAARHAGAGGWEGVLADTRDLLTNLGDHPPLTDETLALVKPNVHVIVGDRDNTVSIDESRDVASMLPNGNFTVLQNTPHPIEQVDVEMLARTVM